MQIKEAYRALAKRNHPDLCDAAARAEAEVRFKIINEARTQLLASHGAFVVEFWYIISEYY